MAAIHDAYGEIAGHPLPYSFNEELAYTIAHGAALVGRRSAAILKSHGLAKAANSVVDSLTAGTTGGFVAIITDDRTGRHSDSIFNITAFLKGTGIPFAAPETPGIYRELLESFLWSERLQLPVAFVVSDDALELPTPRQPLEVEPPPESRFQRDPLRHVLCPPLAGYQHQVLQARLAQEDWEKIPEPPLLVIPDSLPPEWQAPIRDYLPLFEILKELRGSMSFVGGDTGMCTFFAFPPYGLVDACTYYGGSLPLAVGALLAGKEGVWAITGDYSFLAAGHMGLYEAAARSLPLKLLVLHNGCAATTGGQPIPPGVFERAMAPWHDHTTVIADPGAPGEVRAVLSRVARSDRLEIVVADYL